MLELPETIRIKAHWINSIISAKVNQLTQELEDLTMELRAGVGEVFEEELGEVIAQDIMDAFDKIRHATDYLLQFNTLTQ